MSRSTACARRSGSCCRRRICSAGRSATISPSADPTPRSNRCKPAAQAASAHDFIIGFPQGYDTPVGERGTTLSGGQKQRIAIARALLLNPRLLILDDSTSSVDLQTEYNIQKALDNLMHGRTSFVIAQRISTVLNADQILVLDKGRVAARGTHEELLESSPIYAEIYHSQLIGDAAAAPAAANRVQRSAYGSAVLHYLLWLVLRP